MTLWIGSQFFYDLNHYFQLSAKTLVVLSGWHVKEVKEGAFSICVDYQFQWEGQNLYGTYNFKRPTYQNPYLAKDHIKEWSKKAWTIWLNPNKPSFASLQKEFPMRKGINLILCLAILLYFVFLKGYVNRINRLDRG